MGGGGSAEEERGGNPWRRASCTNTDARIRARADTRGSDTQIKPRKQEDTHAHARTMVAYKARMTEKGARAPPSGHGGEEAEDYQSTLCNQGREMIYVSGFAIILLLGNWHD